MLSTPYRRSRMLPVLTTAFAAAVLLAACTAGNLDQQASDEPELEHPGKASAQLMAALEQLPDLGQGSSGTEVKFGDTEALRDLLGTDWYQGDSAYVGLQGFGSFSLRASGKLREEFTAVDARAGEFIASTHDFLDSARSWTTVTGGQDPKAIRKAFLELGWEETDSGVQVTEKIFDPDVEHEIQALGNEFWQVRLDESTVEYGALDAVADRASGVLANDPRLVDLAACLGDVMAVTMIPADVAGHNPPEAYAVGLRTATSLDEAPQLVVCSSWQDAQQAEAFATEVTNTLKTGTDEVGRRFHDTYPHPTVEQLDGEYPLVQAVTDTTDQPFMVLEMFPGSFPGF